MNASAATATELPAGIQGLDTQLGLSHMAGKKPLYLAMLRRYADSHADAGHQIRASLASGDSETAQRLAHTLKSVSATLGAVDVQRRAADLEHALCEGDTPDQVHSLIAELERPLGGLVAALHTQL